MGLGKQPMKRLNNILHSNSFFIFLFLFLACYLLVSFYFLGSKYSGTETLFEGTILSKKIDGNYATFEIKSKEKILIYYQFSSLDFVEKLKIGDVIQIKGALELPQKNRNFNLFNYRNYLKGKQIYWILNAENIALKESSKGFYLWKDKLIRRIQKRKNSTYYFAFLLGDSSNLEFQKLYQELGISHLFAVSGMHILFIAGCLSKLFQRVCSKKQISFFFVFLILTFYVWLLSDSASANRAYFLYILSFLNKQYKWEYSSLKLLYFVATISILRNPFCILQMGFQFSFLICFFLLLKKNASTGYLKRLLKTSFLTFLVSLPLSLYHFNQIHLGTLFFNMIAIPFVTTLLFPFALLSFLIEPLELSFSHLVFLFEGFMQSFKMFSFMKLTFASIPIIYIAIYYIVLIAVFKKSEKWGILFVLLLFFHFFIPYFSNDYFIDMIDIGQGDSILIRYPHLKGTILVDCGGSLYKKNQSSDTENTLIPYFKTLGIKKIDVLIITHGDYDHAGNALALLKAFPVKQIIMNSGNDNELEQTILKSFQIPILKISERTIFLKNQKFQFLNSKTEKNENEDSLVFYTKLANKNILFMGDAGKKTENKIKKEYKLPKMDILKVGHHGSKNSSGLEFLEGISPKISLISAGVTNQFLHPHKETLENLSTIGSHIYSTKKQGSIRVRLSKQLQVSTCLP